MKWCSNFEGHRCVLLSLRSSVPFQCRTGLKMSICSGLQRFRTLTPVSIYIWLWKDTHSTKEYERGALLLLKVVCYFQITHEGHPIVWSRCMWCPVVLIVSFYIMPADSRFLISQVINSNGMVCSSRFDKMLIPGSASMATLARSKCAHLQNITRYLCACFQLPARWIGGRGCVDWCQRCAVRGRFLLGFRSSCHLHKYVVNLWYNAIV